jgi:hypothetical protein
VTHTGFDVQYFIPNSLIALRSLFVFVKGRGTCGSGERNVKIWFNFRNSPRFSLTSPVSQGREKSSRPVFTMCGEPCCMYCQIIFPSTSYIYTILDLFCENGFLRAISHRYHILSKTYQR